MNQRGTYGNYGNYHLGGWQQPVINRAGSVVGADPAAPAAPGFGFWSFLLTVGIGGLTGHFIAKDPNKGFGLGVIGGFFAHTIMEQTHLLRRINQKL